MDSAVIEVDEVEEEVEIEEDGVVSLLVVEIEEVVEECVVEEIEVRSLHHPCLFQYKSPAN